MDYLRSEESMKAHELEKEVYALKKEVENLRAKENEETKKFFVERQQSLFNKLETSSKKREIDKDPIAKLLNFGIDKSLVEKLITIKRMFLNNRVAGIRKLRDVCDVLEEFNNKSVKKDEVSKFVSTVGKIVEN
jgi:hypothetical protein